MEHLCKCHLKPGNPVAKYLEDSKSPTIHISSSKPQDTVLGPMLFIKDLPDCICYSTLKLFANDCLLQKIIKSPQAPLIFNRAYLPYRHMGKYMHGHCGLTYVSKCFVMRIANSIQNHKFYITTNFITPFLIWQLHASL